MLHQRLQVHGLLPRGHIGDLGAGFSQFLRQRHVLTRRDHQCLAFAAQHTRRGRHPQTAVHHHAQRLTAGFDVTHIQRRIVREHRAYPGQDRRTARAPFLHVRARGLARDPLALAVGHGGASIGAGREFHADIRPAALHAAHESRIERLGLLLHQPDIHPDAMAFQFLGPLARDMRIRIAHRRHDPRHARLDKRLGAWRRATLMTTGLERQIHAGAVRLDFSHLIQRIDLGMRLAGTLMPAFADDFPVLHDHATDPRVGIGGIHPAASELQGARHEARIGDGGRHDFFPAVCDFLSWAGPGLGGVSGSGISESCLRRVSALGSFCKRCTSSRKALRSWKLR